MQGVAERTDIMESMKQLKVTVDGIEYDYPFGTPYKVIADDFQKEYPHDILLVNQDGKLCELHKSLDRNCTLKMITAAERPGKLMLSTGKKR